MYKEMLELVQKLKDLADASLEERKQFEIRHKVVDEFDRQLREREKKILEAEKKLAERILTIEAREKYAEKTVKMAEARSRELYGDIIKAQNILEQDKRIKTDVNAS